MLVQMKAVLTIMGRSPVGLRDHPRITAGSLMVPATLTMASSTVLMLRYGRRSLRHVLLLVGVVGGAASLWWLSSLDNFTAKAWLAAMLACWGAFLGLFPPVFLTDEIEGLDLQGCPLRRGPGDRLLGHPAQYHPDRDRHGHDGLVRTRPGQHAVEPQRESPPVEEAAARTSRSLLGQGLTRP